jgi:transposase
MQLSAQRIYQDLVEEMDFQGSYDSVKRYVRKYKKKHPQHFEKLPIYPGREAQVDFGSGPGIWNGKKRQRSWVFKITLSYSKHSYEELVFKQDVETFLRCHENAFRSFGGVPESVKLDNLKSGVLRANLYEPVINPAYLAFAEYWGFAPNPCAPYHPEQKGRVERDVSYTKSNALKGREFKSLEEGNLFLRHWNKRWARTRIHGTMKLQVWPVFKDVEQTALKPLREGNFPFFKIGCRKVDVHGHIEVQSSYYSIPHLYIGQKVAVHFNSGFVKVYKDGLLIARHRSALRKGSVKSMLEHRPPHKPVNQEQEENWKLIQAKNIGPNCHRLVYKMLSQDDIRSIHRVRGIMSLKKRFPAPVLEEACAAALSRYSYRYATVKSACEAISSEQNESDSKLLQDHELIRDLSEYQNIIN